MKFGDHFHYLLIQKIELRAPKSTIVFGTMVVSNMLWPKNLFLNHFCSILSQSMSCECENLNIASYMDGVTLHSQSHRKHQNNYELFLKTTTWKLIPHLLLTSNLESELTFENMCRSDVINPVKRQKPYDVFQNHVAPGIQGRNEGSHESKLIKSIVPMKSS